VKKKINKEYHSNNLDFIKTKKISSIYNNEFLKKDNNPFIINSKEIQLIKEAKNNTYIDNNSTKFFHNKQGTLLDKKDIVKLNVSYLMNNILPLTYISINLKIYF